MNKTFKGVIIGMTLALVFSVSSALALVLTGLIVARSYVRAKGI